MSLYADEVDADRSTWVTNADLGYQKVPVQRPRRARVEAGPAAVERLRDQSDWNTDDAITVRSDQPDTDLKAVEDAVSALPADGLGLGEALKRLKKADGWSSLLKAGRLAVTDAITIDDPDAEPLTDPKGNPVPDKRLKGVETVPLGVDIDEHMATEVHPHAPDAWAETDKVKIGYEIPFTEIFYEYEPPPPLEEIDAELKTLQKDILDLLAEVTE